MRTRLFSMVALLAAAAMGQSQIHLQRNFLVSGKDVFMFLPADFVCGPTVKNVFWAPDGKHIAVEREVVESPLNESPEYLLGLKEPNADPETQLLVYSLTTKKLTIPITMKRSAGQISSVQWIAGSSSMIVDGVFDPYQQNAHAALAIVSPTGKITNVATFEPSSYHEAMASPYKPIVLILERHLQNSQAKPTIRLFGLDGVLSEQIALPNRNCMPLWSKDGHLYFMSLSRPAGAKTFKKSWFTLDMSNHDVKESSAPADADAFSGPVAPGLTCENLSPSVSVKKLGVAAPTVIVTGKASKDNEFTVVSTDGEHGELAPSGSAVSFHSQGSLMVRSMVKVDLEAYLKARDAALKLQAMQNAKQAALAAIMYAGDYDDNMLAAGPNWKSQLEPYIKDISILDGFNYTFAGGNATQIQDPANTAIGYSNGPGGKAVAYADGHVRWVPNP